MRRILLSIALALVGIFASVMALPSKPAPEIPPETHVIIEGLYVALPSDIKTFPVELVALP
jgi:hypothetical protein